VATTWSTSGLTAILDWELGPGRSHGRSGWFCAQMLARMARTVMEAGGIASRADFYRATRRPGGRRIDAKACMTGKRWPIWLAVIALQQADRIYFSGPVRAPWSWR